MTESVEVTDAELEDEDDLKQDESQRNERNNKLKIAMAPTW